MNLEFNELVEENTRLKKLLFLHPVSSDDAQPSIQPMIILSAHEWQQLIMHVLELDERPKNTTLRTTIKELCDALCESLDNWSAEVGLLRGKEKECWNKLSAIETKHRQLCGKEES